MRTYIRPFPGTANQTHYLAPTFIKDSETIGFSVAFSSIGHSQLVPLPVRTIKKRYDTPPPLPYPILGPISTTFSFHISFLCIMR